MKIFKKIFNKKKVTKVPEDEAHIIAAIMAGVYAGELWGNGSLFDNEFGADSITHLYEYMEIGKNIEIPYEDDGITICTEEFRENIYNIIHEKYKSKDISIDNSSTKLGDFFTEENIDDINDIYSKEKIYKKSSNNKKGSIKNV